MKWYTTEGSNGSLTAAYDDRNARRGTQSMPVRDRLTWLMPVPLVLLVIAAFIPILDNGFVNWDDDKNFLDNPFYRGLGAAQWKWAWSTFWLGVYQPLAWLLFEAQFVFWKLDPRGYHLVSVVLHATNSVVLYVLTVTLLGRSRPDLLHKNPWACTLGAGLATALFAVHPLRVEVVAWASCQPYLPCALFSMLAVLSYIAAFANNSSPRRGWLAWSFALFIAALLFHAVAVSLPVVLLVLDVYPLRRLGEGGGRWLTSARVIGREKVPFAILSILFTVLAIAARRQSLVSVKQNTPLASLAQACHGIWTYILKTVLPLDLVPVYPSPRTIDWFSPPFMLSIVGTLAVSTGFFIVRRRWPGLLAAWLCYLVILVPNSGIIRINDQFAADRYSYFAMLGWVIVMAGCLRGLGQIASRSRSGVFVIIAAGLGLVVGLFHMTWSQCRTWRDSETLWTHALNHGSSESALAHYNLALILYRGGQLEAAEAHDVLALRLNPGDAALHNNLGVVLQRQGKLDAAATRYADAIRLNPDYLDAHFNLGNVLSRQGRFEAAARHYAQALRLNPGFADAHHNLGVDLFRQGKLAEAEAQFDQVLRLNSGRADTHTNLGVVLSRMRKYEQAAAHYAEALRIDPGYTDARTNLEIDLARQRAGGKAAAQ